jgi:hypothetical protein
MVGKGRKIDQESSSRTTSSHVEVIALTAKAVMDVAMYVS